MFTAERLRSKSRVDYLLYLWFIEDIIRAHNGDMERIEKDYLPRYQAEGDGQKKLYQWFADLCEMMRSEGCLEQGHLQIVKNVEQELTELHQYLLNNPGRFPDYTALYNKCLPAIVELRSRNNKPEEPEMQTMLGALYGVMLLILKGKEGSTATNQAVDTIGQTLHKLSDYYLKNQQEPLDNEYSNNRR